MNKTDILKKAGAIAKSVGMAAKEHAPEICQIVGGTAIVGGIFMWCKSTLKLEKTVEESTNDIQEVREEEFESSRERGKELTKAYFRTGWRFTKLYGPAAAVSGTGIFLMCWSSKILKDRYTSMAAAYTMLSSTFSSYRGRARERFGDDVDHELLVGSHKETVKEKVEGEDGKMKTVKKDVETISGEIDQSLLYFEIRPTFPDGSKDPLWNDDRSYMVAQIMGIERELNEQLNIRAYSKTKKGKLYLNEVLDKLYRPRIDAGQVLGYVVGGESDPVGDAGFVSLGIRDIHRTETEMFEDFERDALIIELNQPVPLIGV